MKELPEDIVEKLIEDFGEKSKDALELLRMFVADYPDESERICRCAVYVAKGNVERLVDALSLARLDYRDLIVEAEYENRPGKPVQVRNFNQPFHSEP